MRYSSLNFFRSFLLIIILVSNCSPKKNPVTGEVEIINPNVDERARAAADKNPIIIFGDNKKSSSSEFLKSNPLWRASLKSLDFIPLASVDFSGGLIITDWYSENNSEEEIKISVRFLSSELKSDSITIVSHKRICDQKNKCRISALSEKFNSELKEVIINSARVMAIEDKKKENK